MIRNVLLAAALLFAAPALAETQSAKHATPEPSAKMATEAQRLDLNAATIEQLMSVKGFNKTIAEAIVKGRPFKSVDDLSARKIVSGSVLTPVKDQLIVR
ncbi:ComEA family DNA-binding protein [Methylocystis parvus]|uniref:Helix-hairpin-helix domain-containing protein n=1 Tax=Methylocystis parvus TaxID=134 RepID=A0A6B8M5I0_9HYPH|nr:helix-hairpin-helix domain-containing protein [Methylocystis parvus]QGM97636.1 helix-hairpin-helix domain-containing protein [Methylocystis parvus]WBJ98430.1 helix-hairpin-helix domain-containing protein [Methylocystis parvus OBBP]